MSEQRNVEKLIIVGSGPAGWTAAIYAARANLNPLIFAGRPKSVPTTLLPGGQLMLTTDVENYPGFPEGVMGPLLMSHFERQAVRFFVRSAPRRHTTKRGMLWRCCPSAIRRTRKRSRS